MKTYWIALGSLAMAGSPALAQSTHNPPDSVEPYLSVFGIETSSHVIGDSKRGDGSVGSVAQGESADDAYRGAGAGLLLGYERRFPSGWLLGAEVDWAWLRQEGREDFLVAGNNAWNGMLQASILRETQWLSTARVHLGYASGSFTVQVTGGLALASLSETRTQYEGLSGPTQTVARFSDTDHATPIGWTIGVGGAWRMTDAWSLRVDYLHSQFDEVRFAFPNARGGVVSGSGFASVQGRSVTNDLTLQTLRIGLTYRFGSAR